MSLEVSPQDSLKEYFLRKKKNRLNLAESKMKMFLKHMHKQRIQVI